MDTRVISTTNSDAVDFEKLKVHCRVRHDMDDALLRTYLKSAVSQFEAHTSRKVLTTGIELQLSAFPVQKCMSIRWPNQARIPTESIILPFPPFQELTSINYLDVNDVAQTTNGLIRQGEIFAYLYSADADGWPDTSLRGNGNEVTIAYKAGFGADYNSVPEDLQVSLMVLVGIWYEDREVGDVPDGVKNLWGPWETEPVV